MQDEPVASAAALDFTWKKFLALVLLAAAITGGIQYRHSYYVAQIELILYYWGMGLGPFVLAAVLVLPLHYIGKLMTNGFTAPRRSIFYLGCFVCVAQVLGFMLRR